MEYKTISLFNSFIHEVENGSSEKFIDENIDKIKNAIFDLTNIYINYPKWLFLSLYIENSKIKNPEILIIGDLHADFYSLKKIIQIKLEYPEVFLIFLGDYIDRGRFSNEVLILVILLNLIFPSTVFLLPGNHELYHYFRYQNPDFWVQDGKISLLFEPIKNLIEVLPVIVSFENILLIHGGLFDFDKKIKKDNDFIDLLQKEKGIKLKSLIKSYEDKIFDLVWADYADNDVDIVYSKALGRPVKTGEDLEKIKNNFNIELIIRGHQPSLKGTSFNKKVVTLITCFLYSDIGRIKGDLIALIKSKYCSSKSKDDNIKSKNDIIRIVEKIFIDNFEVSILQLL